MRVNILYLYYDIMNLYGENGNIRMIERVLKNKGAEVEIDRKTITDNDIDFTQYDFVYCGAGTELSRDACIEHLRKFKESLKEAFENDTVMLFTGNSFEMLGKIIHTAQGQDVEGLGLFGFTVKEQKKNRYSGDVKLTSKLFDKTFIGYINKCSKVEGIENPLFEPEVMAGNLECTADGIQEKNFYGTQVIGPIMVKNPEFAEHIARLIVRE
ncbi:MAG: hypothetical protein IKJ83_02000 [Ruminococcus sp.]|nr:hypothetical protein [Ruminococcus sp.]